MSKILFLSFTLPCLPSGQFWIIALSFKGIRKALLVYCPGAVNISQGRELLNIEEQESTWSVLLTSHRGPARG